MRAAPIFQLTIPNGAHSLVRYKGAQARPLQARMSVLQVATLLERRSWARGIYLLTSLDGMTESQLKAAQRLYDRMKAEPQCFAPLNNPSRVKGRFEVLRALHERGQNDFNVHRASEPLDRVRFPAFVRYENLHRANLSGLVHSQAELEDAVAALLVRGEKANDLLVTEHLDYKDEDGVYRKYGAHIVGSDIVQKHLMAGRGWMIKMKSSDRRCVGEDEHRYIKDFPHRALLEPVFALSGHEWGRADYSFYRGRIQVWEINDNPEFGTKRKRDRGRARIHRVSFPLFESALERASAGIEPGPAVQFSLGAGDVL